MNEVLPFTRDKQRRSNVLTLTRLQPFCKKQNINLGCYDGFRV